jgi:hypothetical protein
MSRWYVLMSSHVLEPPARILYEATAGGYALGTSYSITATASISMRSLGFYNGKQVSVDAGNNFVSCTHLAGF